MFSVFFFLMEVFFFGAADGQGMDVGDGGEDDGANAVMGCGRDACVGSGGFNQRDCCRFSRVIRELWKDLPYSFPFFLKILTNDRGSRGW